MWFFGILLREWCVQFYHRSSGGLCVSIVFEVLFVVVWYWCLRVVRDLELVCSDVFISQQSQ